MSSIQKTGSKIKSSSWRKRWGVILVGWAVVSIVLFWMRTPSRLVIGQIVDSPGLYQFPKHRNTIEIRATREGWLEFTVRGPISFWERLLPWQSTGTVSIMEARRDWFLTVDEYARVWKYAGEWSPEWGDKPFFAENASTVNYPRVNIFGPRVFGGTRVANAPESVSSTGKWQGIPPQFFKKLPTTDEWVQQNWGLPQSPPPMSSGDKMLLERWTEKWR